jgi:hypothetical protein
VESSSFGTSATALAAEKKKKLVVIENLCISANLCKNLGKLVQNSSNQPLLDKALAPLVNLSTRKLSLLSDRTGFKRVTSVPSCKLKNGFVFILFALLSSLFSL